METFRLWFLMPLEYDFSNLWVRAHFSTALFISNFFHKQALCCAQTTVLIELLWWRHQMETFSALLAIYAGNSPVPGELPAQRPVTRSFHVFFDLRLNKSLSKQSWGWWLRRYCAHYDVIVMQLEKSITISPLLQMWQVCHEDNALWYFLFCFRYCIVSNVLRKITCYRRFSEKVGHSVL